MNEAAVAERMLGTTPALEEQPAETERRYEDVLKLLRRTGPLAGCGFEAGRSGWERLREARVLVVGAGGLGTQP